MCLAGLYGCGATPVAPAENPTVGKNLEEQQSGSQNAKFSDLQLSDSAENASPATSFTPETHAIYLHFKLEGAPKGTKVRAEWVAEKAEGLSAGQRLGQSIIETTQESSAGVFTQPHPASEWPKGSYVVTVYVDGLKRDSLRFTVE
jgi:hypothetical protein